VFDAVRDLLGIGFETEAELNVELVPAAG
jgi:hypothetical protein